MASYQTALQFQHRASKRARIVAFFLSNIGKRIASPWLHGEFGTSFRARVSEINTDKTSPIILCNENCFDAKLGQEVSVYWAELRLPEHMRYPD